MVMSSQVPTDDDDDCEGASEGEGEGEGRNVKATDRGWPDCNTGTNGFVNFTFTKLLDPASKTDTALMLPM